MTGKSQWEGNSHGSHSHAGQPPSRARRRGRNCGYLRCALASCAPRAVQPKGRLFCCRVRAYRPASGKIASAALTSRPAILKSMGLPDLAIMNGDTESNVDTARARAEQLISEGAQLLVGAFNSGHTTAIAQVAEQKGIPLVINIAASPAITEQGYKFVFRNFPTAPMIRRRRLRQPKGDFRRRLARRRRRSSTCM